MQNLEARRVLDLLSRQSQIFEQTSEMVALINDHCNFVDSWNKVPIQHLRVFAM